MRTVKDVLARMHEEMGQFEAALRGVLENHNIADVIGDARGKIGQAMSHADAETELAKLERPAEGQAGLFDPNAGHAGAR